MCIDTAVYITAFIYAYFFDLDVYMYLVHWF